MSVQSAKTSMPAAWVIEPKLTLPRVHAGTLRRARLLELLDREPGAALTMVDAAVGYGKTTRRDRSTARDARGSSDELDLRANGLPARAGTLTTAPDTFQHRRTNDG